METELFRSVHYQNYAEELRIIAADSMSFDTCAILLAIAEDYERMAHQLRAVAEARAALNHRQQS